MFEDRYDAGRQLARKLAHYADRADVIVLALPRGGVPVGSEVAKALNVPLDVFLVRKLGVPGHEELAMGAVASGGIRVLNKHVIRGMQISDEEITSATLHESEELARRQRAYRGNRPPLDVQDMTVILIDDGLATGSTMRAAVLALRRLKPASIVVAVPVGAAETCRDFQVLADEVICARAPKIWEQWGTSIPTLNKRPMTKFSIYYQRVVHQTNTNWRQIMIRKLKSGEYRLYSRKVDPKTNRRRNLGTFATRAAAEQHEKEIQYFKRH